MLGFKPSSKLLVSGVYAAVPELPDYLLGLGLADTLPPNTLCDYDGLRKFLLSFFILIFSTFSMRLLTSSPIFPYRSGT